ncbi:MAG: class IV adenylate cyclase [Acidobacteriota bacterium]
MARNLEIKARVADLGAVRPVVSSLTRAPAVVMEQADTFFVVPNGRLKIRMFPDGSGELIAYERPNRAEPTESVYWHVPCARAGDLVAVLAAVLPVRGQVRKRREVFIIGRTRVHLDEVERLGSFVELEVVLRDDEPTESGDADARALMQTLGIHADTLVPEAYIDLLERVD